MSAAIDGRLEKLEAEISARLNGFGVPIEEVSPTQVLEVVSESYQNKRISGLPVAKRKDHLQVVYRFTTESMDDVVTWGHKNVGCVSIWRLLVVPGDFVWVIGVNFFYALSNETDQLGYGIASCENPDDVDTFLQELENSPVRELLTSGSPVGSRLITNVIGCRGDFVFDPKFDVVVSFECNDPEKRDTIISLFDIIVREESRNLLGIADGKTPAQRSELFFNQLEDKLAWTQEHAFVVVRAYAHLLYRMHVNENTVSLHFVVDAYRYHFCQQISSMLKELGACELSISETPAD